MRITALQNISLHVDDNEFLCVLGPSGCGKTTLLKIMAGLVKMSSGEVHFEGGETHNNCPTAMVFQEHGILPWLNVIDNICFGLEMQGLHKEERYERAMPVITRLGLANFRQYYPYQLSFGMKQRVGIARALVSGAKVLLMDEPFASLDAQLRLIAQEQLLDIHSEYKRTIIYVTHDIEEAILLADRITLMTRRPGHIKGEVRIPFRRPRNAELTSTSEFNEIRTLIWRQIKEEVEKSLGNSNECTDQFV